MKDRLLKKSLAARSEMGISGLELSLLETDPITISIIGYGTL